MQNNHANCNSEKPTARIAPEQTTDNPVDPERPAPDDATLVGVPGFFQQTSHEYAISVAGMFSIVSCNTDVAGAYDLESDYPSYIVKITQTVTACE